MAYHFLLPFLPLPSFLKDQQTLDVCMSPFLPSSNLFHLGLDLPPPRRCLPEAAHVASSPQRMMPKPASLALPFLLILFPNPAHISSISNGPLSISISQMPQSQHIQPRTSSSPHTSPPFSFLILVHDVILFPNAEISNHSLHLIMYQVSTLLRKAPSSCMSLLSKLLWLRSFLISAERPCLPHTLNVPPP